MLTCGIAGRRPKRAAISSAKCSRSSTKPMTPEALQVVDRGRVSVGAEAEETGLSWQIVCRTKDAPAAADAAFATWGLRGKR